MNNIKQIEVIYDNRLVGRLALTKEGLCAFEYLAEWLGSGFSISPFELPLKSGVFIAKPRPFEGGFGVFDDCLPDGWGLLILDRYLQQKNINPRTLTLLDRLALVGSTGRGALEFRPDHSVVTRQDYVDFEKLALEAEQILDSDDYTGKGIEEFQDRGGSPGGARPKIFVRYDNKEWLVKFRAKRDPQSIGIDEYRAKNFAFIYRDGDWHFAPAYDLLPSDGINGFRTTSINDKIEPTKEDLFAVAIKAGLNEQEADVVFSRIDTIVRQKEDVVANCMR